MADGDTDRWALPLLSAGQAQKEITHNEALVRLDLLVQAAVESDTLAVPPVAPVAGQCWLVAEGAGGGWAGHDGEVAGWTGGGWRFIPPRAGMRLWVIDAGHALVFDAGAWGASQVRADGFYVDGLRVVSARQPAIAAPVGGSVVDNEARDILAAIVAALQMHGLVA